MRPAFLGAASMTPKLVFRERNRENCSTIGKAGEPVAIFGNTA
jgi:hypothetical protein